MNAINISKGSSMWTDVVEVRLPGGFSYKGTVRAQLPTVFVVGGTFLCIYAGVKAINRRDAEKRKKLDLPSGIGSKLSFWKTMKKIGCQCAIHCITSVLKGKEDDFYKNPCIASDANANPSQEAPQPKEKPDAMDAETPRQETIIRPEATVLVAGYTNTGKSILALQIAVAAAGGKDYLTLPDRPPVIASGQKVLYISTEDNIPQSRITRARTALGDNQVNFGFKSYQHPASKKRQGVDEFACLYDLIKGWIMQQRGDCMVVIDNLSVFESMSVEQHVKRFYNNLDELKSSYRRSGGYLTFLLVAHTADSRPDVQGIKGSGYLVDHAWPILMHCKRNSKNESSPRYLVLHKVKDDKGGSDETYDFDYCTDPFPHYELATEDVNTSVNEDVNVNESVNTNVNDEGALQFTESEKSSKSNAHTSEEVIKKIRHLYQSGEKDITKIAKLCNVTRPTVYKYTKDLRKKLQRT